MFDAIIDCFRNCAHAIWNTLLKWTLSANESRRVGEESCPLLETVVGAEAPKLATHSTLPENSPCDTRLSTAIVEVEESADDKNGERSPTGGPMGLGNWSGSPDTRQALLATPLSAARESTAPSDTVSEFGFEPPLSEIDFPKEKSVLNVAHKSSDLTVQKQEQRTFASFLHYGSGAIGQDRSALVEASLSLSSSQDIMRKSGLVENEPGSTEGQPVEGSCGYGLAEQGVQEWLARARKYRSSVLNVTIDKHTARSWLDSLHRWSERLERSRMHAGGICSHETAPNDQDTVFHIDPVPGLFVPFPG